MGDVSVLARVFPEDPSRIEAIKEEIGKRMRIADLKIEDIGFGVQILKVMVVVPDKEGGDVEEKLKSIPGVSQVQIESVSLV